MIAPRVSVRRIIAEWVVDEWWVMFEDGRIQAFLTQTDVLSFIKKQDRRRSGGVIAVTEIEWRGERTD